MQLRVKEAIFPVSFLYALRRPSGLDTAIEMTDSNGNAVVKTFGYCGFLNWILAFAWFKLKSESIGQKTVYIHCLFL